MGQLVRLEMAFRYEMLRALGASEWTFASVRAHMRLEVARLLKLLQTALKGTDEQLDLILWALYSLNGCHKQIELKVSTLQKILEWKTYKI